MLSKYKSTGWLTNFVLIFWKFVESLDENDVDPFQAIPEGDDCLEDFVASLVIHSDEDEEIVIDLRHQNYIELHDLCIRIQRLSCYVFALVIKPKS